MNPLGTLLGLPVSGPLGLLNWIARQIANAATQQLLDPARIETALLHLERQLEDGLIDEATFEAEEERLLAELAEITTLRAAEANAASAEDDSEDEAEDTEAEAALIHEPQHPPPPMPDQPVPQEANAWTLL